MNTTRSLAAVAAVAAVVLAAAAADAYTLTIAPTDPGAAADPRDPTDRVACGSTTGEFTVLVHHGWAPHGAKRFVDLVRAGFFTDIGLFRRNNWIIQFGAVSTKVSRDARWRAMTRHGNIPDDPDTDCFGRCKKGRLFDGALSYAGGGPNTRAAQMFIVHHQGHQPIGHELWETPFAEVEGDGLDRVIRKWYAGYGEGVDQGTIFSKGNAWLRETFPKLDYLTSCRVLPRPGESESESEGVSKARAAVVAEAAHAAVTQEAAADAGAFAAAVAQAHAEADQEAGRQRFWKAQQLRQQEHAKRQAQTASQAAPAVLPPPQSQQGQRPPPPPPPSTTGRMDPVTAFAIAALPLLATAAFVQLVRMSRSFF